MAQEFKLTPSVYPKVGQPPKVTTRIRSTAPGVEFSDEDQRIQDMIENNPEYANYSVGQKRSIFEWLKNKMKGNEGPMPDFLESEAMPPSIGKRNQETPSVAPKPAPAATPAATPATKPVGPKDVMANAKAPDYVAQRYAAMTPDQMNTAFLNDVIKRRMGYASGPMDEQLSSWGRANGQDESQLVASMNRHYAGIQAQKANNPYGLVPKDQLKGRSQGDAYAMKLLMRGDITPDQMPNRHGAWMDSEMNGDMAIIPDVDNEALYQAQARQTGFWDSRENNRARAIDQDFDALQKQADENIRNRIIENAGRNAAISDQNVSMVNAARNFLPTPVREGTTFAPSSNVNDYIPTGVPELPRRKNDFRVRQSPFDPPRDASSFPGIPNLKATEWDPLLGIPLGRRVEPFRPQFKR